MRPPLWAVVSLTCGVLALTALAVVVATTTSGQVSAQSQPSAQSTFRPATTPRSTVAHELSRKLMAAGISCQDAEPQGVGVLDAARCELFDKPLYVTSYEDQGSARAAAERLYEERRQEMDYPYVLTQDMWVIDASADMTTGVGILRMFPDATKFGA